MNENPIRPKKSSSKKKIVFSQNNETFSYSYQSPEMKSVKKNKAIFPQFEDKVLLNINFAYFNLDVSLRECSITSPLTSYPELCAKFEDSTSSMKEKNIQWYTDIQLYTNIQWYTVIYRFTIIFLILMQTFKYFKAKTCNHYW